MFEGKKLNDIPKLEVLSISKNYLYARFEPSKQIGENWIGYICISEDQFVQGRYSSINKADKTCDFYPEIISDLSIFEIGSKYPFFDGYWGKKAEIVLSNNTIWRLKTFYKSDAELIKPGVWKKKTNASIPEEKIIKSGWDHEHCCICSKTISENNEKTGYVNDDDDNWLCSACYQSFVLKKDLSFMG